MRSSRFLQCLAKAVELVDEMQNDIDAVVVDAAALPVFAVTILMTILAPDSCRPVASLNSRALGHNRKVDR